VTWYFSRSPFREGDSMLRCLICALSLVVAAMAHAQEGAQPPQPGGKATVLTTAYGTTFDAYITGPTDATRGVLLLHDRYGLNNQARDWAERFAALGYRALAIDLYDGRHAKSWEHATSIMHQIDPVWADTDIAAALHFLKKENPKRKLVILGWDYGATQALRATLKDPSAVALTICYYPTHLETDPALVQTIVSPVLIVVAERDEQLSRKQVQTFKDSLSKTRVEFNVLSLDADRGFTDPASDRYDAAATASVWEATQDFLSRYITP
jgi:carboxymethylenebutenolidase